MIISTGQLWKLLGFFRKYPLSTLYDGWETGWGTLFNVNGSIDYKGYCEEGEPVRKG